MWKKHLLRLQPEFPKAVHLYRPATATQIERTERLLGVRLADLDPHWLEFLRLTNGASVLDYCLLGAMTSRIGSIADANTSPWDLEPFAWRKERFTSFVVSSTSLDIGFVRGKQHARCVAYLCEPDDRAALPIASSFEAFMNSFLQDVEATLRSWRPVPGEEWPYGISDIWPLDLKSWCDRDVRLKEMLRQGMLDDVFMAEAEYLTIVKDVLRG